jgi:hypothetical protein
MFTEIIKAWSTVPGITAALWNSGFVAKRHGWSMARKAFLLHYFSATKNPKLKHYALSIADNE